MPFVAVITKRRKRGCREAAALSYRRSAIRITLLIPPHGEVGVNVPVMERFPPPGELLKVVTVPDRSHLEDRCKRVPFQTLEDPCGHETRIRRDSKEHLSDGRDAGACTGSTCQMWIRMGPSFIDELASQAVAVRVYLGYTAVVAVADPTPPRCGA
jgi:hypothetical protein